MKNERHWKSVFIEINHLNQQNREEAIRFIMKKVTEGELNISVYSNQDFIYLLKRHPPLLYEAMTFKIRHLMQDFLPPDSVDQ